ncbi:MAG: TetR/AcrR family transcriptional regulator, partial [Actinobacteria bacterium]|nr:TetR/AcrR family transcriptional regulator [Actinomycetota bacterium]
MTLPPGMAVAWGARPPGRRGPKPTFTVAQIVAVAVELGDADGYVAISLPRIAARLGVTATAVHRQVGRRDELLALLLEAGWGTPPPSVRRARGWRRGA